MSVTIHISVEEMAKHEAQLRAEMISELRPWMKHYMACKGYGGLFQREGEIVTDCTCGLSASAGTEGPGLRKAMEAIHAKHYRGPLDFKDDRGVQVGVSMVKADIAKALAALPVEGEKK